MLVLFLVQPAGARTWTTVTGEHFEADFVRVEGAKGIFKVRAKDYPYPLNRLSVPDRLLIGRAINQQGENRSPAPSDSLTTPTSNPLANPSPPAAEPPAPSATSSGEIQLAGDPLKPGGSVEIDIPITEPASLREVQQVYGKPSRKARMLIAVPEDFAPQNKSYPLLLVTATADGAASSIGTAHQFVKTALGKGVVVLAVDGEFGKPPKGDPPSFRWALSSAGLDAVKKEWPAANNGRS